MHASFDLSMVLWTGPKDSFDFYSDKIDGRSFTHVRAHFLPFVIFFIRYEQSLKLLINCDIVSLKMIFDFYPNNSC